MTDIFTINIEEHSIEDEFSYHKYPSGFYYDHELENPMTRVTLHANTKYTGELPWPWKTCKEAGDSDSEGYSKYPILSSILSEDFSIDIANTYSPFGGDPIAEMWNSQKAMAPYMSEIADAVSIIADKTGEYNDKNYDGNSKWLTGIQNVAGFLKKNAEKQKEYLSRSLIVKGTQFSYYGGTGINFNNMTMKTTILSDWVGKKFVSVIDKLIGVEGKDKDKDKDPTNGYPLLPYVIGDFIDVTEGGDGEIGEFVQKYASWQLPPGGFRASLENVDSMQDGTLKLRVGPYYTLNNLVISGCSLSLSKTMIRNPDKKPGDKDYLVPMSCDISLQLQPAAKYSRKSLEKVLRGKNNDNIPTEISKLML